MTPPTARITILVDNRANDGLEPEHGLSLWIETRDQHILFDTGQGGVLEGNARALGIDLRSTDTLVLSHGHYDHSGGMGTALRHSTNIHLYCHPLTVHPRYSIKDGIPRQIHMPVESMSAMDAMPSSQLHWVQEPVWLGDGIGLTGPIPRENHFEDSGGPFFLDPKGKRVDAIDDDMALWIRTDDGLIVCVGCSHAGLANTLSHVSHLNHGNRIRAVIGGFHLLNADDRRVEETLIALGLFGLDLLAPCHCTGERAVALMRRSLGDRVVPGAAGMVFRF
ncbi:MAG: MBL fold metallo-hydrolase [Desulfobacterales bacterium]